MVGSPTIPTPAYPPRLERLRERPSSQVHGLFQERFGAVAFATLLRELCEGIADIQMLGVPLQQVLKDR
jgi:hypothetical protein